MLASLLAVVAAYFIVAAMTGNPCADDPAWFGFIGLGALCAGGAVYLVAKARIQRRSVAGGITALFVVTLAVVLFFLEMFRWVGACTN